MSAPQADQKRTRDIKIKTGVVKRIAKEKEYYEKEAVKLKEQWEKMKADGKCEHDVKKQEEIWQESNMMIPDCERKLKNAWEELHKLTETEADLNETEEYKAAVTMLEDTRAAAKQK